MRPSSLRPLFVGCGLLVLTNGVVFYVANRVLAAERSWEEPFTRAMFAAVAVGAVAAVALDRQRLDGARLRLPARLPAAIIAWFTAWIVASSLWSLNPDVTRGRALIYVGLAAFAWIVADLDFADFRRATTFMVAVAVAGSLVAVAVSDSIGLDVNDDWRGIFTSRNSLAPIAALAILLGASAAVDAWGRRRIAVGPVLLVLFAAVAMLGSGSRTAWLGLAVAAGVALFVVGARTSIDRHGRSAVVAFGALGSLAALVGLAAASRLWGETTFEQRRTIWDLVWDRIAERPLQGYGWFNVWTDAEFVAADPLLGRGSAHNSFLEVWLGLGIVGLLAFGAIVGFALWGTVTAAWRHPSAETATWLALVVFLVFENLTESFVLWFSYNWVLLMAAALRCGGVPRRGVDHRTPVPSEPATV